MHSISRVSRSGFLSLRGLRFMVCIFLLSGSVSTLTVAGDLIASHGDWTVAYSDDRDSIVTTTRTKEKLVFGFVCKPATKPNCFIGAHLLANCGKNTEVNATILINNKKLTGWGADCEVAENPDTGKSDRVLLSSSLGGDSVSDLLEAMQRGRQLTVSVASSSGGVLKSDFSLTGYANAAKDMIKVLGWETTAENGIGGDDGTGGSDKNSAKNDLEKKKWSF